MPRVKCPNCGFKAARERFETQEGYKCPNCNEKLLWKDVATQQEKRKDKILFERAGRRYVYPFQTIRPYTFKRLAYLVQSLSDNGINVSKIDEKELIVYVKNFLRQIGLKCSERVARDYAYVLIAIAYETSLA